MVFSEDDLLPLSALSHLVYCERRTALIHLEQQWAENRFTAEGRTLHEKAHSEETEARTDVRIVRGLRLHSRQLGLVGIADVVEFHRSGRSVETSCASTVNDNRILPHSGKSAAGVHIPNAPGLWKPYPVEYKRGKPKPDRCDEVQLCAQALCLEEMLGAVIESGAIFYGRPRRRLEVVFDSAMREETESLASRLHELFRAGITPPAIYERKCSSCSLIDLCQPKATGSRTAAGRYIDASVRQVVNKADDAREPPTGRTKP